MQFSINTVLIKLYISLQVVLAIYVFSKNLFISSKLWSFCYNVFHNSFRVCLEYLERDTALFHYWHWPLVSSFFSPSQATSFQTAKAWLFTFSSLHFCVLSQWFLIITMPLFCLCRISFSSLGSWGWCCQCYHFS